MSLDNFSTEGNRILVVDDEPVTRMMLRQVLENAQYLVFEADDGKPVSSFAWPNSPTWC